MTTNPTNGLSQFTAPYDILPNTIYTNPTNAAASQFIGPYNIQTNQENIISTGILNPTNAATSQLNFSLGSNLGNFTKKISPYITPESILLTGLVMLLGWIFLLQRRRKIKLIESVIRDLDKVA